MDADPVILPMPIELLFELLRFFSLSLEAEKTSAKNKIHSLEDCAIIERDDECATGRKDFSFFYDSHEEKEV